ncbi:phosphopantothenate--cysteine ligase isoform X2 [Zalophus californianus]|uniref:Phosphopantothenate--cysteine ligase isoform X2 n=1 Tax=Zalophus californianus TaxID=9704 RepID=A0A6J2B7X6_ZALCA|nr:phosphopantothenate--cysteine ligase isoform X2 [Zalophus californianus]
MHFRASRRLCGATKRLRLPAPSCPWSSPLWRTICICCRLRPRRSIRWITMKMVPKMLSPLVKDWAPKAFIISFKLETDPSIVIDRARNALEVYRHQVVVANSLESRRSSVVILTKDSETKILLSEEEVEKGIDIEEKIVGDLQSRHTAFIHDN